MMVMFLAWSVLDPPVPAKLAGDSSYGIQIMQKKICLLVNCIAQKIMFLPKRREEGFGPQDRQKLLGLALSSFKICRQFSNGAKETTNVQAKKFSFCQKTIILVLFNNMGRVLLRYSMPLEASKFAWNGINGMQILTRIPLRATRVDLLVKCMRQRGEKRPPG